MAREPQVITDVSALSVTLDGLTPFTTYECTISASTGAGEGASSGPQSAITDEDVPQAPANLTATATTPESITVSWQAPEIANGIIINYMLNVTSGSGVISRNATLDTTFMATTLSPFTNYTFAVSAVTSAGAGTSVEIVVATEQDAPSAPLAVVAEAASSTSFNVTWSPPSMPNGIITHYQVTYTRNDAMDAAIQMMDTSGPATMIQLSGLERFANYTITVQGFTVDLGDASDPVTVRTNEDVPGPVTNLVARDRNATSILVTFSPPSSPNGIITRYQISYMVTSAGALESVAITEDLDRTMFEVTITGLEPFTEYSVSVVAATSIGSGTAEVQTVTTDPTASSPPTNVNAEAVSSDSISITWSYPVTPRGEIVGYIIQYSLTSDTLGAGAMELNLTLSPRDDQLPQMETIGGLMPFTQYSLTIRAYSFGEGVVHNGDESAVVTVRTLETAPTTPRNFSLSPVPNDPQALQADWIIPIDTNGVIRNYTIMCNDSEIFVVEGSEVEMNADNEITATLMGLDPFTVYECSVSAATDGGVGDASETAVTSTEQDVPSAPMNFSLSMVSNSPRTLMASWMEPDPTNGIISNYTIRCNNSNSTMTREPQVITDVSALSATLDGLMPFTTYECTISASTGAGEGASSGPQSATTDEEVPGVPRNLTASEITSVTVNVSWLPPEITNGIIISYSVAVTAGSDIVSANTMTLSPSYLATTLTPFTNYTFRVAAMTSAGIGMGAELTVTTAQDAPSAPQNVMAEVTSSTSVDVTWNPPSMLNGIITHYEVNYTRNDVIDAALQMTNTPGAATMVQLSDLDIFANYTITVRGFTVALGDASSPVTVTTNEGAPSAPLAVMAMAASSTSVNVTWSPPSMPNGIIRRYQITYTRNDVMNAAMQMTDTSGPATMIQLSGLERFANYTITVLGFTVSLGEESDPVTVRTNEDAPSAPLAVVAEAASSTSVDVTWSPPSMLNGIIRRYQVTYTRNGVMDAAIQMTDTSGPATMIQLSGLERFANYNITVQGFTVALGEASDPVPVRTNEDVPGPVTNLMAQDFNATSILVTFSPPSSPNGIITRYEVRYMVTSAGAPESVAITEDLEQTMFEVTITGLEPFTEYFVSVVAETSIGPGTAVDQIVTTDPTASSPPTNVNAEAVSPDSISVTWSYPDTPRGDIEGYIIRYDLTSGMLGAGAMELNLTLSPRNNQSQQMVTIGGLMPFTQYSITIRAYSFGEGVVHNGELSAVVMVSTLEAAPTVPRSFSLSPVTNNPGALQANWTIPETTNGIIQNYTIMCNNSEIFVTVVGSEVQDISSTLDRNFDPFTVYECSVSAATNGGVGNASETAVTRTEQDVPSAPMNFQLVMVENSPRTLMASWMEPNPTNGVISNYTIRCNNTNSTMTREPQVITNVSALSATLDGLTPFTTYECTISASTGAGEGASSGPQSAATDEDVPGVPRNLTASDITSVAITVSWSPPEITNGIIISYYVNVTGPDNIISANAMTSARSYVATILTPFTNYTFRVAAMTSAGIGMGTVLTVATAQDAPAGPPNNLAAIAFSPTTINVTWEEPNLADQNGVITSYTVTYRILGAVDEEGRFNTSGTRTTLENLEEFTQYEITVNASTAIGTGPGAITTNRTLGDEPGMKVIVESFVATSNTSVSVRWSALEEIHHNAETETISYMIVLTNTNTSEARSMNTSNLTMNIQGLVPFTVYRVKVAAVNSIGLGPFSDEVTNQTFEGVPGPPRGLTAAAPEFDTAMLSWTRPLLSYGIIMGFVITYRRMDEEEIQIPVGATVTQHSLIDLRGNSVYMVMVQAETSAGRGEPIMAMFSTPSGPPPVVMSEPDIIPMLDDMETVTTTSFTVEFDIIEEQLVNGPVDKIRMFVQRKPSNNATITTYYESNLFKANFPQYAALDMAVQNTGRRKRQDDGGMTQTVMIGSDMNCGPTDDPCNGPLQPGAQYGVRYDLFSGDEVQSYPFFDTTFSTMPAPSATQSGVFAGAALAAIVILVLVVVLILVIVFIMYNRRKSGKADMSLLPADENKPQHKLQDLNHSIVPKEDGISTPAIINARFQLHHVQANTRKVYVRDFAQHLQGMLEDSGYKFSEEYERVTEIGLDHAKEGSLQAENRAKNRYTNILAYDHSRVKLSFIDDEPGSDYINASYIPGHRMRRAYVATQGPLPATFDDFWRMVWEQNTHIIVMLTQLVERGRTKCHRYWPGTEPIVYGDIAVEMLSEKDKEDWTIREFKLSLDEKRHRLVRHFQFTSWPDHGVPENPVTAVDFVKTVRCYIESIHGPIVVHCSAGVGRTGCFLALDTLMLHIKDHDFVDVFGLACEMRQHRNHMIQTEAQYVFIHKALLEILDAMATIKNGTIGSHYSQGSGYPTLFINRFAEESLTPMSDYYGEGLSEETHM